MILSVAGGGGNDTAPHPPVAEQVQTQGRHDHGGAGQHPCAQQFIVEGGAQHQRQHRRDQGDQRHRGGGQPRQHLEVAVEAQQGTEHRQIDDRAQAALVAAELEQAKAKVAQLSARLRRLQQPAPALSIGRNEIRIWMDGAFDMFHYGHANAFRQGRSLGTYLVVGVNDDASITECKGPPVLNDDERIRMVSGCKFVDEVRLA